MTDESHIVTQAEAAQRLYTKRAAAYNSSWHPDFAATFVSRLPVSEGQKVLDLACGTGLISFNAAVVAGSTGKVLGVDVTPSMLNEAIERKRLQGADAANVNFVECDVMKLGREEIEKQIMEGPEGFDAVTMASALVLFEDPVAVIRLMKKYAKPGGFIAVDVPHPKNLIGSALMEKTALKMGLKMPFHRAWVEKDDSLKELLEKEGLAVETYEFIQQQGYNKRYYEIDQAEQIFDEIMEGVVTWPFKEKGLETVEKARQIFKELWAEAATDGKVEDVDGVFFAIARKPTQNQPALATRPKLGFKGGCRCGKVQYSSSHVPEKVVSCHCFTCSRLSGSGFILFAHIPASALSFTSMETLGTLDFLGLATRTFCTACGSPISMKYRALKEIVDVTVGSIDMETLSGELPKISSHIFLKEKQPWDILPDDGAKRHDEIPGGLPGTRDEDEK